MPALVVDLLARGLGEQARGFLVGDLPEDAVEPPDRVQFLGRLEAKDLVGLKRDRKSVV